MSGSGEDFSTILGMLSTFALLAGLMGIILVASKFGERVRGLLNSPSEYIAEHVEAGTYEQCCQSLAFGEPDRGVVLIERRSAKRRIEYRSHFEIDDYLRAGRSPLELLRSRLPSLLSPPIVWLAIGAASYFVSIALTGIGILGLLSAAGQLQLTATEIAVVVFDSILRGAFFDLLESFDIPEFYKGPSPPLQDCVELVLRTLSSAGLISFVLSSFKLLFEVQQIQRHFDVDKPTAKLAACRIFLIERFEQRLLQLAERQKKGQVRGLDSYDLIHERNELRAQLAAF